MADNKFESITRSQLIEQITAKQRRMSNSDIKHAVESSFDYMSQALSMGERIEIRGFGSFSLHFKKPKIMRHLKTKEVMHIPGRNIPYFKPSSLINKRLNKGEADTAETSSSSEINPDKD